jgi:hypothetical protein
MTFLPIVERELRVAARRKGTYLTRVGVGLGAMVLGAVAGLVALLNPAIRFGTVFFQILSGLAMVYCLGAGRFLTADCLSSEKREETMGLLFLTDLKGYDVVLGKMAATSLNGLYGLLAVLPVLALTLLTGGITQGEFCRVALALLDAFLFSLAVGVLASALTREFRSAMALNFYLLLALAGLLPGLAGLMLYFQPSSAVAEGLFLPCPVYTLVLAFEAPYKLEPEQFWSSAAFILAMSWALVALACRIAPRSWQDKPLAPAKTAPRRQAAFRSEAVAFRQRSLDQNAYYWLAARPWWKGRLVWGLLGVALFWLVSMIFSVGWLDETICLPVAFILNGAFKFWITLEAGQTLAEDMRSGAFELLLATPLSPMDIVRGQLLALRRLFLKPLLVTAGINLLFMGVLMTAPHHVRSIPVVVYCWLWPAAILMLAADTATLSVVAMEAALTEKNLTRASLKTVRRVLVLPWALWAGVLALERTWSFLFPDYSLYAWWFDLGCWFGIGMLLDFLFARGAWRRLTRNFRALALRRFEPAPPPPRLRTKCAAAGRALWDNVLRPPTRRKWALGFAAVLLIGASVMVWDGAHPHDPPPEVVLTGPGNATALQAVSAGQGVFLILPDGSLWRWGLTEGTNRAVMPERVGTNRDWKTISANGNQRLGVRRDGTLWEWQGDGAPAQVGADKDWVEAVGNENYKVARKNDGTLWAWGDVALTNPPPSSSIGNLFHVQNPMQLGTNRDWLAVQTIGNTMFAMRPDGTLWVWGDYYSSGGGGGGYTQTRYSEPTQLCMETNWIGFDPAFGFVLARNDAGEFWYLHGNGRSFPSASASIRSTGLLFAHTSTSSQLSKTLNPFGTRQSHYEIHTNGTLWFSLIDFSANTLPGALLEARQAGPRTDWLAVARARAAPNGGLTTFGLTADGTLWTWGWNLGEKPTVQVQSRIEVAKLRAKALLSKGSANIYVPGNATATYPVQEKPRALMKLAPENAK